MREVSGENEKCLNSVSLFYFLFSFEKMNQIFESSTQKNVARFWVDTSIHQFANWTRW